MRIKELFPSALLFQRITRLFCRNQRSCLSRGARTAWSAPALFLMDRHYIPAAVVMPRGRLHRPLEEASAQTASVLIKNVPISPGGAGVGGPLQEGSDREAADSHELILGRFEAARLPPTEPDTFKLPPHFPGAGVKKKVAASQPLDCGPGGPRPGLGGEGAEGEFAGEVAI
jgi:hypothetical protein